MTWAFLTRAGSEGDLLDEIGDTCRAERFAPGIVLAERRPRAKDGPLVELAFARQAMRIDGEFATVAVDDVANACVDSVRRHRPRTDAMWTFALQVVVPDSGDPKDPRRRVVQTLEASIEERLRAHLSEREIAAMTKDAREAQRLLQVWLVDEDEALVGLTETTQALSKNPGGKVRMRRAEDSASRAGLKLEEAIAWAGIGPEKGETCADLGAAPGGWSQVAVRRGASVVAVDPARITASLPPKRFIHARMSAFEFVPRDTLDWLLCDMAWRPLEVAKLVAKWGRRAWARQLIANFKLPMKKKASMIREIVALLESGGWRDVRARQLYFDRDEVTIFAWLDPKIARRGAQPPFEMRSGKNRAERKERPPRHSRKTSNEPRGERERGPRRASAAVKKPPRRRG